MRKIAFTEEDLMRMHFKQNLNIAEIARRYGCCPDTVRNAMRRYNIVPRGKFQKPLSDDEKSNLIILYCEQKLSCRQIAKIIGRDKSYVSNKLKEIGINVDDRVTALQSDRNPDWKGGTTNNCGYVAISTKSSANFRKREHQIVMENYLGRALRPNECVHHIDGNKANNNINNLALMDKSAHTRLHSLERWNKE